MSGKTSLTTWDVSIDNRTVSLFKLFSVSSTSKVDVSFLALLGVLMETSDISTVMPWLSTTSTLSILLSAVLVSGSDCSFCCNLSDSASDKSSDASIESPLPS